MAPGAAGSAAVAGVPALAGAAAVVAALAAGEARPSMRLALLLPLLHL